MNRFTVNRFQWRNWLQGALFLLLALCCVVSLVSVPAQAGDAITLAKSDGTLETVSADNKTGLFAIATWCPHCKHLVALLQDPEIAQYTGKLNIVFVLKDEGGRVTPAIKNAIHEAVSKGKIKAEEESVALEQQLAELKAKTGGPLLYAPDVLKTLPGQYMFITPASLEKTQVSLAFFPASYSEESKKFDGNPLLWISDNAGIPDKVLEEKARQYGLIE